MVPSLLIQEATHLGVRTPLLKVWRETIKEFQVRVGVQVILALIREPVRVQRRSQNRRRVRRRDTKFVFPLILCQI